MENIYILKEKINKSLWLTGLKESVHGVLNLNIMVLEECGNSKFEWGKEEEEEVKSLVAYFLQTNPDLLCFVTS